jgi:hypothetical protein
VGRRAKGVIAVAGASLVGIYLLVVGTAYLNQGRMVFPSWAVVPHGPLRPGTEQLTIDRPDGTRLHGLYIPPAAPSPSDTLVLVFPGNASNAQALAEWIADIVPDHPVAAFYYRGYAPSTGTTEARHLLEDAPLVFDLIAQRYRPRRIVALGQSLGTGVASGLAPQRPLAGLILVTPFESLKAVARDAQPWLPVSLLFRHDMDSAAALRDQRAPVAIIAAGRDTLVRPARTDALRQAVPNLAFDLTIPEAAHNDVHLHPAFAPAVREALARFDAAQSDR